MEKILFATRIKGSNGAHRTTERRKISTKWNSKSGACVRAALLTQKLCHPNTCIRELIDFRIFLFFFFVFGLPPFQKYNIITFLPLVLFQQFRFFLNLYFLIMALSQFIPDIRISYLYTYWGPLGFVLTVTICREAVDDFRRHQRDREVNSQKYRKCIGPDKPLQMVSSSKLKVNIFSRLCRHC